jgi:hypothetical protein
VTAEVAILNKLAVALAADSAVTISEGQNSRKVFNTADKLFELSQSQPIACMIFSGGQFMQAPLPVLLKSFRSGAASFSTVDQAADGLLGYLKDFANSAGDAIKVDAVRRAISPTLTVIRERVSDLLLRRISDQNITSTTGNLLEELWDTAIGGFERVAQTWPPAAFIGRYPAANRLRPIVRDIVSTGEQVPPESLVDRVVELLLLTLRKAGPIAPSTGMVVAGYGDDEIFPTLVHLKLYEPVLGVLKYQRVEKVDIARSGPRARVMAFAQREMAERFLYGLDARLKDRRIRFCRQTVSKIGDAAASLINMDSDEDRTAFRKAVGEDAIRRDSQRAVEDMVEFMPKQDLAEFAEALVSLSSLQHRVSAGFETVGGPIDVAVISKSEGLVWVKRKHYFPPELNARFFNRLGGSNYAAGQ